MRVVEKLAQSAGTMSSADNANNNFEAKSSNKNSNSIGDSNDVVEQAMQGKMKKKDTSQIDI